jgi:hypothetical protein
MTRPLPGPPLIGGRCIHGRTPASRLDNPCRDQHPSCKTEMTVHQAPGPGQATTPCCDRTPFELPATDGLTTASLDVTCTGPKLMPAVPAGEHGHRHGDWIIPNTACPFAACPYNQPSKESTMDNPDQPDTDDILTTIAEAATLQEAVRLALAVTLSPNAKADGLLDVLADALLDRIYDEPNLARGRDQSYAREFEAHRVALELAILHLRDMRMDLAGGGEVPPASEELADRYYHFLTRVGRGAATPSEAQS